MTDWLGLLTKASEGVQMVADKYSSSSRRNEIVGTGASGDRTLVVDREAERELVDSLSSVEGLRILSEEMGESGPRDASFTAILDPIDGSANFSRGIPFYCTSICVVEGRSLRDSKCALVRDLVSGGVYYAERGKGARKNGEHISPSAVTEISEAVAGADLSKASPSLLRGIAPLISALKRQVHFGANALELCLVAEGLLDAFVDVRGRMRVTDIAAAYLVVTEAGGVATSETGKPLNPTPDLISRLSCVAAGNPKLHGRLLRELSVIR